MRDGADVQLCQPEALMPKNHSLRAIRPIANSALERLSVSLQQMYSGAGRPSRPEHLLRALLLQGFFSLRSERQLMEHMI